MDKYYQITSIDLYSRKRILTIVNEHSSYETAKFVSDLENKFGFKIKTIQTDNGSEFVNNAVNSDKKTFFQKQLQKLAIRHITTRPYSPWQNGVVERSHREDGKRLIFKYYKYFFLDFLCQKCLCFLQSFCVYFFATILVKLLYY